MVKELCHRCSKPVYPTDKVGPLKDSTFFHQGCFKCYICGTRLALKTYCNNRNDINDQEIYCNSHVPISGPHNLPPMRNGYSNGTNRSNGFCRDAGLNDLKIAHAIKATQVSKPYPKIKHAGARYVVDYDAQTRLELMHRKDEDKLYEAFDENKKREYDQFEKETKEEWEQALTDFARKYEKGQVGNRNKEDLIRHLTIKRDKKLETLHQQRKERERLQTAELVDRQAKEMLELFKQARVECDDSSYRGSPSYPATPPPPQPPVCSKRDIYTNTVVFEAIDEVAITMAQSEITTFTELIRTLTANAQNDIEKARAIYRWITIKNLNVMQFDSHLDSNTPMGLLRGIKYGTESYHVLFKRLCSYAGLHCVVIRGYSKSAGYQPGYRFEDNRFRNTWNAVYLNGSWRFVQCNWGARHLVNAKEGNTRTSSRSDSLRYEYDDHYFMTDPQEFIYEFFPQESEWQLLKNPITLSQFEALPFVRSLFFRYGLSFTDPNLQAVVKADRSGAATISITMSNEALNSLIFHYNLRFFDNDDAEMNGYNLKRFVMQSVIGDSAIFRVHCPSTRSLLLDIFANAVSPGHYLTGQPIKFKSICKFKIICEKLNVIMVPLPECASGEWGPAKAYRLFGLIPLTHEDAIINCGRILKINFRMMKPLAEFVASLHMNQIDDRNLQSHCQTLIQGDIVRIQIDFYEDGQYGLDIYTRESSPTVSNGGKQLLTHCCKYLINVRM
ncbi:unnamed protein product [Onchocerca ochengi]|uniref:LIM zinc-binding domain-containing protein n=1 Tax=Onchocerca ochengi TaxID=42157 RepID=A0A182E1G0_ONCOC|nr:unnamed protein product [Onchocerca ochengi]